MSEERVGIIVEVRGGQEALNLLRQIQDTINQINKTRLGLDTSQAESGLRRVGTAAQETGVSIRQTFTRSLSFVRQLGSSFQVLGKTLLQLSAPFRYLFRSTLFAAGFKLLNNVTSGFQAAADRYDTMRTYVPVLKAIGAGLSKNDVEAEQQLSAAYDKMLESILPLPTGMGEMIERWKLLTIATQDYNKAAELTIAENNAIIASGTDERTAVQSKRMLQTLLTTGQLTQRQWMSLQKGIPVVWNIIEKQWQESGKITGDLMTNLKKGTISVEEFTDALIEVGQGGQVKSILNEITHTFGSATQNIKNYTMNMGKVIIDTVNEILKKAFGKDIIDYILGFSKMIENFTEKFRQWLLANPEIITGFVDAIRKIDWKGFLEGLADGLKVTVKQLNDFFALFGGKNAHWFGYFMGRAPMWGKVLHYTGALLKGFRIPIAGLMTLVSVLGGRGIFGIFSTILFGKEGVSRFAGFAEAPTALNTLRTIFARLSGVLTVAGTIAIASGTGFVAFKAVKSMISDLKDIIDLIDDIDWDVAANVISGMLAFFSAFAGIGSVITHFGIGMKLLSGEAFLGALTTFAAAIAALDMRLLKDATSSFLDILGNISEAIDTIKEMSWGSIDLTNFGYATEAITNAYTKLQPFTAMNTMAMATSAESMANVLKNMKVAVDQLAEFETIPEMGTVKDNLTQLTQVFIDVFEIAEPLGKGEVPRKSENIKSTIDSISETIKSMYAIIKTLNKLSKAANSINVVGAVTAIKKFAELRDSLFKAFFYNDPNSGFSISGVLSITPNRSYKTQAEDMKFISSMFSDMLAIITTMSDLWAALKADESIGKVDIADFLTLFYNFKEAARQIARWWSDFNFDYPAGGLSGTSEFSSNLISISSAIGTLTELVGKLDEFKKVIGEHDSDFIGIITQTAPFVSELNGLSSTLNLLQGVDVATKVNMMNNALDGIKKLIETAKSLEGGDEDIESATGILSGIAEAMESMGTQLSEIAKGWSAAILNGIDFEGLNGGLEKGMNSLLKTLGGYEIKFYREGRRVGDMFRKGLNERLNNINVSSNININAKLGRVDGIDTLVNGVRNAVQAAFYASDFSAKINAGITGGIGLHSGGIVQYRANGGSIFKPRGADTVPAMLTPNEFVMRTKAVDTFGLDFMKKVNSLNVAGAMQALQARISSRLSGNRTSTINNVVNNNNNQRMTQNVYTNNQNFAFKRSRRYVGAL